MSNEVKYPHVKVKLSGADGNAFMIMGKVNRELKKAKVPQDEIDKFQAECISGDYDHLLQTCMQWVTVS